MGVRFLGPEELLEELLPAIDFQAEERVLGGYGAQAAALQNETPPPLSRPPSGVQPRRLDEPAAPTRETVTTAPPSTGPAPHPSSTGTHEIIQPTQLFPLRFRDPDQFRRVFDRDVKTGGLFIHTSKPPALDAVILVEVVVEGLAVPPIRLQARVVHRMESPPDSPPGNLLAGMGVQFLDVTRAVEQLRGLLR